MTVTVILVNMVWYGKTLKRALFTVSCIDAIFHMFFVHRVSVVDDFKLHAEILFSVSKIDR